MKEISNSYLKADLNLMLWKLIDNVFSVYSFFILSAENESKVCEEVGKEYRRLAHNFLLSNLYLLFQKYLKLKYSFDSIDQPLSMSEEQLVKEIDSLVLCHYTSFDAFKNIINSRQLWFNCLDRMNDIEEGQFLIEYIRNIFKKNGRFLETLQKNVENFYSISFTTEEDDSSQWDRYGENGKGICIVTNFSKLSDFFYINNFSFSLTPILYLPFYEKNENNIFLDSILSTVISKNNGKSDRFALLLGGWCPFVKNYSFHNESEFRIICQVNNLVNSLHLDIEHKKLKLFLDEYMKEKQLDGDPFSALFEKIIIGPSNQQSLEQIDILLNSKNSSKIKIEKSKSTFVVKGN